MTPEQHQRLHVQLHRALDELLGCWIAEGFARGDRPSIHDEIFVLLKWAHDKTLTPSSCERDHYLEPIPPTAQSDDPETLEWLSNAKLHGGGFVSSIAEAALRADPENWKLMRLLIMALRAKYPAYEPSDAVKQEIRERAR